MHSGMFYNCVYTLTPNTGFNRVLKPSRLLKEAKSCTIIDTRTPLEFNKDHIQGAINLPVLSQAQHEEVGTLYHQNIKLARKKGAQYMLHNLSELLDHAAFEPPTSKLVFYCARGGQRSQATSFVFNQVGLNNQVVEGGYKAYRKHVMDCLQDQSFLQAFSFTAVAGRTGSGKTHLLKQLEDLGEQVLDLEALCNHKGSVLGVRLS